MSLIRANRDSIDDRFNVLGFTVSTEHSLFEIAIATDPDLLKPENRGRRAPANFFTSQILHATPGNRREAIYLVPPNVLARFIGQPRLYFGVATFSESDRTKPLVVRIPDRGHMYVNISALTERGLRRSGRNIVAGSYGTNVADLTWGGDSASAPVSNGVGNAAQPAPYSDGYSDELWKQDGDAPRSSTGTPRVPSSATATPSASASQPAPAAGPAPAAVAAQLGERPAARSAPPSPRSRNPRDTSARSLLVSNYYQPTNWLDALTSQIGFFIRSAMWYLGVTDTRVPPHSAICQVRRPDGTDEGALHGSAFFIAPRLLLTAGHVVDGQSELIIIPGKNGAGMGITTEPFGRFNVSASQIRMHPSYGSAGHDFDMALICVPAANAAGADQYFDLVEELTQSREEGVIVSGYAARWYATDAIERFVNDTIDPNLQHMMGGHIRTLPSDDTFDYDLQTLGGTSGSPVYWIEEGSTPRAHMVGVHVAAHSATTNLGCRITAAKLAWIRQTAQAWGQSISFSLSVGRPPVAIEAADNETEADAHGITEPIPDDDDASPPSGAIAYADALDAPAADYPGASRFAPAARSNYRRMSGQRTIDRIVIHITDGGSRIAGTIGWFQNPDQRNRHNEHITVSAHYVIGQDGEVVQMVRNSDVAWHASSANANSIGIEHVAHKRHPATARTHEAPALPPSEAQYAASALLVAWLCDQYSVPVDREHIVGHMEASPRDQHDCPSALWDWNHYMDLVQAAAQRKGASSNYHPDSQGPGRRSDYAVAQEIITPYYDPSNTDSALTCQADAFSQAREEWFVGVEDTHAFPHSAICQLNLIDRAGGQWEGTGFYVGRNRILTCAHNLSDIVSVRIVPGCNGAGTAPFGDITVASGGWRIAPAYTGPRDWGHDLAVFDDVALPAPNGQWFEFLNATPSQNLPIVVCGYSAVSNLVPELTEAIDPDKQHLHGGYVASQRDPETIDYPILTLQGASGAPVYSLSRDSGRLQARVCAVHVTGRDARALGLNTGCFLTPSKIDWIEGRAASFSLDTHDDGSVDVPVALIAQPDKNSCWAAAMAMLLSWRRQRSTSPETIVNDIGASLATSYDWALIRTVRDRYGFQTIEQPSNASLYHAPRQWAEWLDQHGALWVVIVGAPHAVVVAGIRGNLDDPAAAQIKILNPWDTRIAFDTDPVAFNPPNFGYEDWLPFSEFASDFGNMAEANYGNWRILHLPSTAAGAQALGSDGTRSRLRPAKPPKPIRALENVLDTNRSSELCEHIEPSRIMGTRMCRLRGSAGAARWNLEQLEGYKEPATAATPLATSFIAETIIELDAWPAMEGEPSPLPLTVRFRGTQRGAVGDIRISAGTPSSLEYGVEVRAVIQEDSDMAGVACLKVHIDYRFTHLARGAPLAHVELRLLGDGRYERTNSWITQMQAA